MNNVYVLPDTGGYLYHYLILELGLLRNLKKENTTVYINIPHLKRYNQQYMYDALKYFEPEIIHIENTDNYNKIYIHEHEPLINANRTKVSLDALLYLRNTFLKNTNYTLEKNKYVYISRNDSELLSNNVIHLPFKRRQILNENELIPKLIELGFEIVYLQNYSFEDKIKIFQTSKLIVGPEGSNLTCSFMANKDTTIIGIYYEGSPVDHTYQITKDLNIKYALFSDITRVVVDSSNWSDNMIINIDAFIKYIKDIISTL